MCKFVEVDLSSRLSENYTLQNITAKWQKLECHNLWITGKFSMCFQGK